MCEIDWLPKLLIWSFVGAAALLALVSRRLNDHLLVVPAEPAGPFAFLFRRKYHVKPSMLFDPARHFDAEGQKWARRFGRLMILSAGLLLALVVVTRTCGYGIGG